MLLSMRKPWLALAVLTICTAQLFAQLGDDPEMKSACAKYEETPLPAEALAVAAPKRWPFCNSYKFYAGTHTKADYEAARKCAWSERLASQAGLEPLYLFGRAFGGSAMLTMLYSNGEGVEKNIPLAIRFACESGWALRARSTATSSISKSSKDAEPPPTAPSVSATAYPAVLWKTTANATTHSRPTRPARAP
jgi:hypothetical protein